MLSRGGYQPFWMPYPDAQSAFVGAGGYYSASYAGDTVFHMPPPNAAYDNAVNAHQSAKSRPKQTLIQLCQKKIVDEVFNEYVSDVVEVSLEKVAEIIIKHAEKAYLKNAKIDFYREILSTGIENNHNIPLKSCVAGEKDKQAENIQILVKQKIASTNVKITTSEERILTQKKQAICKELDQYICWWKFSLFGHHHDARARAVKAQVLRCNNLDEIKNLLQSQETILRMKEGEAVSSHWAARWSEKRHLKNKPLDMNTSGFVKIIRSSLTHCKTS